MAQTSVSLYPKYMMGEALGTGQGPAVFSYVTVGNVNVITEGDIRIEQFDSIAVEQVIELPVEVTETVGINVTVCEEEEQ